VETGAIRLTAPGMPELAVSIPLDGELAPVVVSESKLLATLASQEAGDWLSAVAGVPVRLVYLDDPTRRRPNPAYSRDSDRVSFADAYPLLTAIDPDTAAKGREPLATLARSRRWDGKVWFGMNLIPDLPPGSAAHAAPVIGVGDLVEILEQADHSDGPPR
jgi:uncharacterized protein YcbX